MHIQKLSGHSYIRRHVVIFGITELSCFPTLGECETESPVSCMQGSPLTEARKTIGSSSEELWTRPRCVTDTSDEELSCADRCSERYLPGKPCYCNTLCDQYENCCFDYYDQCARKISAAVCYPVAGLDELLALTRGAHRLSKIERTWGVWREPESSLDLKITKHNFWKRGWRANWDHKNFCHKFLLEFGLKADVCRYSFSVGSR